MNSSSSELLFIRKKILLYKEAVGVPFFLLSLSIMESILHH